MAAEVLVQHDAVVDKFVGDDVVAIFIPALAGSRHAERAIGAARALLKATGTDHGRTPWLPLGVGIHTGAAYVGAVGDGHHRPPSVRWPTGPLSTMDSAGLVGRISDLMASG